ncbi:MAG: redoxin domain-containing protein [Anaerolineaceae bacterium]|nr:redoxin domain-containing protein [Anaerolineaceae bacterium]
MSIPRNARLEELEKRFSNLEPRLKESPEKEALSILHAMIHETHKPFAPDGSAVAQRGGTTLEDIANLYHSAPAMEGVAENQGLKPGFPAPDFSLKDAQGRAISLQDFRGKNVVLAFYPLDWSPACSDQLSLYQSEQEEFIKHNTQLLAISVDSIYSHGAWAAVRGIRFPLLSDFNPKGEIARRYQVYRNSDGFTERALYVIDPAGVIRFCTISPELHKIPSIYTLFEQLGQLQGQATPGRPG